MKGQGGIGTPGYTQGVNLRIDPDPDDAYTRVPDAVAVWADKVFDWLEEDPVNPHARRRAFVGGQYAVLVTLLGESWLILWEPVGEQAFVRYLGRDTFIDP